MHLLKHISVAALAGSVICTPALAQETPDVAPLWSADEAAIVTGFDELRLLSPRQSLSSETALRSLLSNLPDLIQVNYGEFIDAAGGVVATDVEFKLGEELPLGVRIGELRVYGLEDSQLTALAAGETADIGSRIDARDISIFGLEEMMETATDLYMDQVETMVEDMTEEELPEDAAMDFNIKAYDFSIGQLLIDGFTWHETPDEVDMKIASLFGEEGPPEGQEAWALFAPLARFYRNFEAASLAYYDTVAAIDMTSSAEGMEQDMKMDLRMPMVGMSGIDRGDTDQMVYRDMSYDIEGTVDVEDGEAFPMNMSGSLDLFVWEDMKLAKLFGYLENQIVPPSDVKDLMSFGKFTGYGETLSIGDAEIYSVGKGSFDLSKWTWFIPEVVKFSAEDYRINVGGYLDFIQQTVASMPEMAEDPEFAEQVAMFEQVSSFLSENDLDVLDMDMAFNYDWDAETGESGLGLFHKMDGFGELKLGAGLGAVTYDEAVQSLAMDEDAGMAEFDPMDAFGEVFMQEFELTDFDLMIDDEGGLDKLFNLIVEVAKLVPRDDTDSQLAMFKGSSPEELRAMISGLTRMSGFQANSIFPPAVEYINGFADFIAKGGKLSLQIAPEEPLTLESVDALMPMLETPDEMVEYLGIEFEYTEPEPEGEEE